jgi:uncharacterized protein YdeI (YjbR/CyaY-like superfamily)
VRCYAVAVNDAATPANELPTVVCPDRAAWRAWLAEHHTGAPGAWLVYYRKHCGKPSIGYEESVLEALCFGWIDGLKRRLDAERYTHRFTPRRANSRWSERNLRWARELMAQGLMEPAGRAAFDQRAGEPDPADAKRRETDPVLPPELERVIRAHPQSWRHFKNLAPGYRRQYVLWLTTAKRPDTRRRRLEEALRLLAEGRPLGMK